MYLPNSKFKFREKTTAENVIKEILVKEAYRKKKIDFKIEPDDIWLDGGSHIGVFALYACTKKAEAVHCFEPEPENYALLDQNAKMMNDEYKTNVYCHNQAINQTGGTHKFTLAPNTWRHSLMSHYKKPLPSIDIDCHKFDNILQNKDINCIKLDIEGSEIEILENDHDWSHIKKLVFEYSFTKNRSMKHFFDCTNRLNKHFHVDIQKSFYNQKYQGQQGLWGGFIDAIIFCKKK